MKRTVLMVVMCIGTLIAWKWEGFGGAIAVIGWIVLARNFLVNQPDFF